MPNKHIQKAIDEYSNTNNPMYALLINAPWGVGKTHFIKSVLPPSKKNLSRNKSARVKPVLYMTLNGCNDLAEFRNRLFTARFPEIKDSKIGNLSNAVASWIKGKYNIDPTLFAVQPGALYIVDDLERITMKVEEALGAINDLVEHHGCKVIILVNREELQNTIIWEKIEEKVIGQTFELIPDVQSPYDKFVKESANKQTLKLLMDAKNRARILEAFQQLCSGNLRVLSRSLRLVSAVINGFSESKHEKYPNELTSLAIYIIAMYNAVHSGIIKKEELRELKNNPEGFFNWLRSDSEQMRLYTKKILAHGIDRRTTFFRNATFCNLFVEGSINSSALAEDLNNCRLFDAKTGEASWRIVSNGLLADDVDFDIAKRDMLKSWQNREYKCPGVILHVFMLKVWLVSISDELGNLQELNEDLEHYLEDLCSNGSFVFDKPGEKQVDEIFKTHGLRFMGENDEFYVDETSAYAVFQNAKNKIGEARAKAHRGHYDDWGKKLIETLVNEPEIFDYNDAYEIENSLTAYSDIPVLNQDHAKFLFQKFVDMSNKKKQFVVDALKHRYHDSLLTGELEEEIHFLKELQNLLLEKQDSLIGLKRHRYVKYHIFVENIIKGEI